MKTLFFVARAAFESGEGRVGAAGIGGGRQMWGQRSPSPPPAVNRPVTKHSAGGSSFPVNQMKVMEEWKTPILLVLFALKARFYTRSVDFDFSYSKQTSANTPTYEDYRPQTLWPSEEKMLQQQQHSQQRVVPFFRRSTKPTPNISERECKFCKNNGEQRCVKIFFQHFLSLLLQVVFFL